MVLKPQNDRNTESDSESFETGNAEDQQTGTSQAQKGEGKKPAQSGKREPRKK